MRQTYLAIFFLITSFAIAEPTVEERIKRLETAVKSLKAELEKPITSLPISTASMYCYQFDSGSAGLYRYEIEGVRHGVRVGTLKSKDDCIRALQSARRGLVCAYTSGSYYHTFVNGSLLRSWYGLGFPTLNECIKELEKIEPRP